MIAAKKNNNWRIIGIIVILVLSIFFIFGIISIFFSDDSTKIMANVALIGIKGTIGGEKESDFLTESVSSSEIIELIEKAEKNKNIKAIIFEINSPGGSAVASDEIASKIKDLDLTTVAWIREVGASGGYWIASATDQIIANRMSITGSIGVIASYLDFSGFLVDHNVSYQRLVSGKYKDIGSPFKALTDIEKDLFQQRLDAMRNFFIDEVATNRNLPRNKVEDISTGLFYLGAEAKDLGLVDQLGGKKEAIEFIEKKLSIKADVVEYKEEHGILDLFGDVISKNFFHMGQGIGNALLTKNNLINNWAITS